MINCSSRADVAEWQTQQTQNLPVVTSCGFDSHHPHIIFNTQVPIHAGLSVIFLLFLKNGEINGENENASIL